MSFGDVCSRSDGERELEDEGDGLDMLPSALRLYVIYKTDGKTNETDDLASSKWWRHDH